MEMYSSTIVTLEDGTGRKYIHDGWIKFESNNILQVGDSVCCSLEFALDSLFVEIDRAS